MKPKLSFVTAFRQRRINFLFRLPGLLIIFLLQFSSITLAQEQTPPSGEFPIGTATGINNPGLFNSFVATGLNTIYQRADENTREQLSNYNLLAYNLSSETEYIYHYSTAYYSKWEAERNQTDPARVGVKHKYGSYATYIINGNSIPCWSTIGLNSPKDSVMYGPHYRQDKAYKRLYPNGWRKDTVKYVPRFNMALSKDPSVGNNEDVCKIKVVYRYRRYNSNWTNPVDSDYVFMERTLKAGDFDPIGSFDDFYLHPNPDSVWYKYSRIELPSAGKIAEQIPADDYIYTDSEDSLGIQFCVDWLRADALCTLYVNYVEIYDNKGWNDFIREPEATADLIKNYADSIKSIGFTNIMYWGGTDEPYSIDCYTPLHIVDSLIRSIQAPPLIVAFDPSWSVDYKINGEDELSMFYNIAKPARINLGIYSCLEWWPVIRGYDFEWLRFNFQRASALDPNFWFNAQTFSYQKPDGSWCLWRKPEPPELISMVMLALAHGAKGIEFMWFDSYNAGYITFCSSNVYVNCVVDENGNPLPDTVYSLYSTIKNNLVPRLKGNLGKSLMSLNYNGDYLPLIRNFNEPGVFNTPPTVTEDYLTLTEYTGETPPPLVNFHAGFFNRPSHPLDKYFMVANLITTDDRWVNVKVANDCSSHPNNRFRNIEGQIDTTFMCEFSMDMLFPPGEGYLFQVAPVILYGGKLIFDETIESEKTLIDDMIIKNGRTLTVNTTYNVDRSLTITEGGRLVTTTGGTVKFFNDQNLIIEGNATISGTSQNKLVLDFLNPAERNGIVIKPGGSLTIINCEIKNAGTGIFSELNANYLSAQNVDFINCADYSINIAGRSAGMNPTPPPQITGCTMLNSNYGIAISNSPGMVIYDNDITNTACGIYLSNVTDAQVIGNTIISNREELEGIILLSSGGAIRANLITGHTVGLQLANSSPILGSNVITANKYHGLYIGDGSLPYMRMGSFIGNPPNFYATSGYNKIFQNGGYEGEGDDNDGSEIYFVNSNAAMDKGCNSIYDDREPSPPLVNTYLLMNCSEGVSLIEMDARINYWGSRIEEGRFGNLRVNYIPYSETPCPEPQDGSAGELVRMTSFGDVIDTVYAVDIEMPDLTETEEAYAEAEEYFLTGELSGALQIYEAIINSNVSDEEKYPACERKYSIGKLTGQSSEYFNQLSNTFIALSSNSQDSLSKKILAQFSTLSKVGEQEYETAIGEFDGVIQQNPNTEEAVYAEIDALTTALLIEESDSTLQKGRLGKYLIKSSASYHQRVNEILRKNFGSGSKENQKELLPTEYTLYQNYPNPFNPTTTIKYDLPNTSDVSLIVFDILGRKIKELVNTKQQAGRYEVIFNASNLASGVYMYQLVAEKYMQSKKMILLR